MPKTIKVEVLFSWLTDNAASDEQVDAVEASISDNNIATVFDDGVATLLHVDTVHKALTAIDNYPWKGENPVEFREGLQAKLLATGIKYWIIGADVLPLE